MNGTQDPAAPQTGAPQTPPAAAAQPLGYAPDAGGFTHGARPRLDDPRRKSPALACVLSTMPGLGQIYVGYYQRGFIHAIVIAALFFVVNAISEFTPVFPMVVVFMIFFWLYNIIDAGRRAAMFNHVLAGGQVLDLPQDIRMPGIRGSVVGGVVAIVVGAILLAHTAYDVPLDWVENWWPASLLLVGGYLVAKGILERKASRPE